MDQRDIPIVETDSHDEPTPTSSKAGFDEFFLANQGRLVGNLRAFGASHEEAEDIAQETFIAAYRRWDTIEFRFPWLVVVARRTFMQMRSRQSRELTIESNPPPMGDLSGVEQFADMAAVDDWSEVRQVLSVLPKRQRQVMALRVLGYDSQEIARATGMTPANVRSSLRHARSRIQAEHVRNV